MARRKFVDDDAELYRVVVTAKKLMGNPKYDPSKRYDPVNNPQCVYSDTETETTFYGPYLSMGAAKVLRTQVTRDGYGQPREEVLGSHIEKAQVDWLKVAGTEVALAV